MKVPKLFLFKTFFLISAFCFGGGYVIIPLIRRELVEKRRFLSECELLDIYAMAQSAPGAIAVNSSALIGYKLGGKTGALLCCLGTILPPFIAISIVAYFYTAVLHSVIVNKILAGMAVGVAAVMISFMFDLIKIVLKEKCALLASLIVFSFLAAEVFRVNVALVLVISALIAPIRLLWTKNKEKKDD